MATAFSTQGATPFNTAPSGGFQGFPTGGATPAAKALNNAPFTQPLPKVNVGGAIQSGLGAIGNAFNSLPKPPEVPRPSYLPAAPAMNLPGMIPQNQSSPTIGSLGTTPVTSHTITNKPDGTTTQKVTHATSENTANAGQNPDSLTPPSPPPTVNPNAGFQTNTGDAPQGTPPANASFSGLVNNAATSAQGNTAIGQNAADIAANYGKKISDVGEQAAILEGSVGGQGLLPIALGRAQQVAQTANSAQSALASGESAALQGTGQQLTAQNQQTSGLISAGDLAQPTQVPYSNEYIDPTTGQPVGGGATGTLPASAQTFVNSIAQQVQNGQMTRDEAASQLNAYGPAGLQALNTALGSNFNTNASNASAGTTATGQQIQTAAASTNQALDTLSSSFSSLPGWQTGTIPAGNSIAQWVGSQLGDSALTQYKTNLADARSQLIGVLNSSGGTPTGNESTAEQYLPDNMTPAQFQQNVGTADKPGIVRQLIQQKVGSFTQSGQQNPSVPTQNGGSLYRF